MQGSGAVNNDQVLNIVQRYDRKDVSKSSHNSYRTNEVYVHNILNKPLQVHKGKLRQRRHEGGKSPRRALVRPGRFLQPKDHREDIGHRSNAFQTPKGRPLWSPHFTVTRLFGFFGVATVAGECEAPF
jgi:hypothetical protein